MVLLRLAAFIIISLNAIPIALSAIGTSPEAIQVHFGVCIPINFLCVVPLYRHIITVFGAMGGNKADAQAIRQAKLFHTLALVVVVFITVLGGNVLAPALSKLDLERLIKTASAALLNWYTATDALYLAKLARWKVAVMQDLESLLLRVGRELLDDYLESQPGFPEQKAMSRAARTAAKVTRDEKRFTG